MKSFLNGSEAAGEASSQPRWPGAPPTDTACHAFYEVHGPQLHRALRRGCSLLSDADCADLVQRTCLEVWARRPKIDRAPPIHYLLRIALRLLHKKRQSDARRRRHETRVNGATPRGGDAPIERMLLDERIAVIRGAVAALPFVQRRAVELVYQEGLTAAAAAAEMGCSAAAVFKRCARARERLARSLSALGD